MAIQASNTSWLGPWANGFSQRMVAEGNRSLLVAGLEPGRFTELSGGGVVYVGSMSTDGSRMERIFVHRQAGERIDVTTARSGTLSHDGDDRYLRLEDGFRVEGPGDAGSDYRLMRYGSNDLLLPPGESDSDGENDPEAMTTLALLDDPRMEARAQLHARIAPPLLALAFALLAVPLARSSPRQTRFGSVVIGFLAYLVGMDLMLLGTDWLGDGKLPMAAGLWWLVLPLLALGLWFYFGDGRLARRPRLRRKPA